MDDYSSNWRKVDLKKIGPCWLFGERAYGFLELDE